MGKHVPIYPDSLPPGLNLVDAASVRHVIGKERGSCFSMTRLTGLCCAAQVQVQLKMVPEKLRGYMYSWGSLLMGALLGVIVYGPMYWTS